MGTQLIKEGVSVARQDINRARFWWEISKSQRSKRGEIQTSYDPISDDVNYINDIIYPPKLLHKEA